MKVKIKTLICIILCISLMLTPFVSASAKPETDLDILVATDCHYRPMSMLGPIGEQKGLPGDPLYWYTNSEGQLTYESDAIMNELLSRFEASSSKCLLIAGDLTVDGYLPEHLALAEKFRAFEEKTGKSIFVINGNHDIRGPVYNGCIDLPQFKSIYSTIGYDEALSCHENSASYTADLDANYRLIAIDPCTYGYDKGIISTDLLGWIETQANQAKEDGKNLIGMVHYSMLEHFKNQSIAGSNLLVKDFRDVSSQFADWGIKYVFTGHVHGNDITGAVSEKGNRIYDIETSCLDSYPNTYRQISFSNTGVAIESKNIDKINTSDLPDGYTPGQLDLIQNDFQAYSYGYFKAGMNCFVNKYIGSPGIIANALKIENDTVAYSVLSSVTADLRSALNLPIYDKTGTPAIDSVQEIAASVGESIDSSEYKNLPDIIGAVLAAHYSGMENIPYDSAGVRLFKQCFKAALVYSLVNIPADAANVLLKELGLPEASTATDNKAYTAAAKLMYMKTAASKLINVIVEPLLQGFTSDSYEPGDLNVTLEAYGTDVDLNSAGFPISPLAYSWDLLTRLLSVFMNAVKALM